ncbi:MAG: FHA domain-containing protein [Caldilineales bacterium]|nr:FHA domain-containing protein [Caldilineales bacterium]MCW5860135.1 FHA domain-containing protein [Caldilineales bacterium]
MSISVPLPTPEAEPGPTLVIGQETPSFAWLVMLNGPRRGRLYPLKAAGVNLGRVPPNDILVDDDAVSRFHARILAERLVDHLQFYAHDLASANGTFVNGQRISQQPLRDEDRLSIGQTVFVFKQL